MKKSLTESMMIMEQVNFSIDSLKNRVLLFLAAFLSFLSNTNAQITGGIAPVLPPTGNFHIEGNLKANTPTAGIGDWLPGPVGSGNYVLNGDATGSPVNSAITFHLPDLQNNSADNNFSGGKKFNMDPNVWTWVSNPVGAKVDMNNALIHFAIGPNGHKWIIFAADRRSDNGDAYIDFEFLQKTLTVTGGPTSGGFSSAGTDGGRTVNDFVLTLKLTRGGTTAGFAVSRWQSNGSGGFDYFDATSSLPTGSAYAAVNSTAITDVSFPVFGGSTYLTNTFVEAAVDLTALITGFNPCLEVGISSIMIKTKESASNTATIVDFINPLQTTLTLGAVDAGLDQSKCSGGSSTSFTMNASVSPAPGDAVSTQTWTLVSGSAVINDDDALNTTVSVTGSPATLRLTVQTTAGCTVYDEVVLTVTPADPTTADVTQPTCTVSTGTITVTSPTGAGVTYSKDGTNFQSSPIFGGLAPNTYTITSLSANGCLSSVPKTVNAQPVTPAVPTVSTTAATCFVAGTAAITNYSAAITYTFTPSGPSAGAGGVISGMTAGTSYTVTATNSSNCTSGSSSPFSINAQLPTPDVPTVSTTAATCFAAGTATITNYSDANTYTFTPSGPSAGAGGVISGMTAGTSYTVTATNSSNCTSGSSAPFSINAQLPTPDVPTVSTTAATCFAAGTAAITNYSAAITYTFTPSGPSAGAGGVISGMTAGTSYTVTATNNSNCTSGSSAPFSINAQLPTPDVPTVSTTAATCFAAGTATITNYSAANTYTFTPSGPSAGAGGVISGMTAGTSYTVTATNGSNCTSGSSAPFSINAQLPTPAVPTVSTTAATCFAAGTATITNYSAANTYTFTPSGPSAGAGGVISGMTAGTSYTVTATNGSNCTSGSSASFSIGAQLPTPQAPTVTYNPPGCEDLTFSVTVSNVEAGAIYNIVDKNDNPIPGVNPASGYVAPDNQDFSFSNIPTGSGFKVTVVSSSGCSPESYPPGNNCVPNPANRVRNTAPVTGTATNETPAAAAPAKVQPSAISSPSVKAFPNPFNDRVKFIVSVPKAGYGTLELMNMQGQRIKTIYSGLIAKGGQQFEMELPALRNASLIYVFRMNNEMITGKLVQLNQ